MNVELQSIHDIIDYLQTIMSKLDKLETNQRDSFQHEHRSSEIKDLFAALSKAQGEMKPVTMNKKNPYFDIPYTDLRHMVEETRVPLTNNGLSVIQQIIDTEDGSRILHTILGHESGQWIESTFRILPAKNDVKSIESYTNFVKRLAYGSIVGVISEGEDDDGEMEMATSRAVVAKGPSNKYDPRQESFECITKEQLEEIEYELSDHSDIGDDIITNLRISCIADMPKSQFMKALLRIRQIKRIREGL